MKFEHKVLRIEAIDSYWLTLVPRKEFDEQEVSDLPCKAIVSDIREKFFLFLKRPFKEELNVYVFYKGDSILIIVNKIENEVYFFERYQEDIDEEFEKQFSTLIDIQKLYRIFEKLNLRALLKEDFKGTGNIKKLEKCIKDITFYSSVDLTILEPFNILTDLLKEKIESTKTKEYTLTTSSYKVEEAYYQVIENYKSYCHRSISKILNSNIPYQKEKWTEWEEALRDWKNFYNSKPFDQGNEVLIEKYRGNEYLNDFKIQCKSRGINKNYGEEVLKNTISRIIEIVSDKKGVNIETVELSLKKTIGVKKKDELNNFLINNIIGEES